MPGMLLMHLYLSIYISTYAIRISNYVLVETRRLGLGLISFSNGGPTDNRIAGAFLGPQSSLDPRPSTNHPSKCHKNITRRDDGDPLVSMTFGSQRRSYIIWFHVADDLLS